MLLYTCNQKKRGGRAPRPIRHPCGWAAAALDDAGYEYEIRTVDGYRRLPWTRRGKREELRTLTGQEDAPVLVLDGGTTVMGSERIVEWARSHPASHG